MVRKLFRILFLFSLLLVTAGFYAWYELGKLLDVAQGKFPAGIFLNYQHHYIDHQGQLTLLEPKLLHDQYGTLFSAEKITYKPPHWLDYWSLRERIILSELPEEGEFIIHNLTLPIEELAKRNKEVSDLKVLTLLAHGCSDKTSFSLTDLVEADIKELTGNFELEYQYNPLGSNIKFQSSVYLQRFAGLEWQLELNDFSPGTTQSPYLVFAQWVLFDPQLVAHRNRYCASLNQQNHNEFVEQHVNSLFQFLEQEGLILSDQFQQRYQLFTDRPENIAVTLTPRTGIRTHNLSKIEFINWVEQLGISLNINGRAIEKIVERTDLEKPKQEVKTTEIVEPEIPVIRSPSIPQLRNRVDKRVVLIDENDKSYEGRIISVTETLVKLEIRVSGGYATVRFKPNQIKSLTDLE